MENRYHITSRTGYGGSLWGHKISHCDPAGCNGDELYIGEDAIGAGDECLTQRRIEPGDVVEECVDREGNNYFIIVEEE